MPEYLAPGVFVEEVPFRSKAIEGVGTATAAFIGPCRSGPVAEAPGLITSLVEFERLYGDGRQMAFGADGATTGPNYLWQAVRSFFEEGGAKLYVSRVFRPRSGGYPTDLSAPAGTAPYADGHARSSAACVANAASAASLGLVARDAGARGNLSVRFSLRLGPNLLASAPGPGGNGQVAALPHVADGDVVWVTSAVAFPPGPASQHPPAAALAIEALPLYVARKQPDGSWQFRGGGLAPARATRPDPLTLADFALNAAPGSSDAIRALSLSLEVRTSDGTPLGAWTGLPMDPAHRSANVADGLFERFGMALRGGDRPPVVLLNRGLTSGLDLLRALATLPGLDLGITQAQWDASGARDAPGVIRRRFEQGLTGTATLAGGNDGLLPGAADYEGHAGPAGQGATGLKQFEAIDDIATVAAPGASWKASARPDDVVAIARLLIAHAERMRYRIALIDPPDGQSIADVRQFRARFDSAWAALYYPWVTVLDSVSRQPLNLPPSGFVAGIYARNDVERGVFKAPADEVVRGAIGFEAGVNAAQQQVLNPEGINVFRFFEGRGYRLWGARTISSDPQWKYVNLRRYFAYLERSLDHGTQWAVFEPNGEALWAQLRATVSDFLMNEWTRGGLLGAKPEQAFFVRCDRSTMTQNDLDNGRLVCLVGVAPLKPAEFVIFRIGQWTADRKG